MSEGTEFHSLEEEGDSSSLADAEQTLQQVQQELELVKSTQTSIERQFSRLFTALRASFSSAIEQSLRCTSPCNGETCEENGNPSD